MSASQTPNQLLGSGQEGCVFRPPLKCKDNAINLKYKDDIMKVPIPREGDKAGDIIISNENEKAISKLIGKIDPQSKHFIALSGDSCLIDLNDKNNQEQLRRCINQIEHGSLVSIDQLNQGYFIIWAGLTLGDIVEEMTTIDIRTLWEWLEYLIKSLALLHSHGIAHGDLGITNITLDPVDLNPRIIDFGAAELTKSTNIDYLHLSHLFVDMMYAKKINYSTQPFLSTQFKELMRRLPKKNLSDQDHLDFINQVNTSLRNSK